MKKIICLAISLSLLLLSATAFAEGGTHTVHTYTKRDGTVVKKHLSGNPGSGIHCHNNVCS